MFSSSRSLASRPLRRFIHASPLRRAALRDAVPSQYTLQIMASANSGNFAECLQIASKMKAENISPDAATYNAMLSLAARSGSWLYSWAIFDDMLQRGIQPTPVLFSHLIHAQRDRPATNLWYALERMKHYGMKPNASVYTSIITCLVNESNIETVLRVFFMMKKEGIVPELSAAQAAIILAAECGYSQLAIEIAKYFEAVSVRRLESSAWIACLSSASRNLYVEGVSTCWPIVVNEFAHTPNEGICLAVLSTAARHGLPELAMDVLRVLKNGNIEWQEYHFAALIEAFCRNDQLKEALTTPRLMRTNGIEPADTTTSFIFECIKRDVDVLDSATTMIDEIYAADGSVDIDALKVVVRASIFLGDLQRAVGIYKSFSDYDLEPDLAVFNLLLEGCVTAQHRPLGDLLLTDMKKHKVQPNEETYKNMIRLCLTQTVYEDAFYYLEEMKAAGYVPPREIYVALSEKCISAEDSRSHMVLQEMRECGYRLEDTRAKTIARRASLQNSARP
ncbi:hypothetical protein D9613_000620 [Agrocybe pediades]|uniref:Pentatricopeptide repeat-containing protein-mitochondrial domain-containing protein n=1 Tax=Agrocybe pediades TaxID=84607 RepID=A0A8H4R1E5_9AGAR|nr:hypothetical protein D9613_000620 [Agrocybe pediades]